MLNCRQAADVTAGDDKNGLGLGPTVKGLSRELRCHLREPRNQEKRSGWRRETERLNEPEAGTK